MYQACHSLLKALAVLIWKISYEPKISEKEDIFRSIQKMKKRSNFCGFLLVQNESYLKALWTELGNGQETAWL